MRRALTVFVPSLCRFALPRSVLAVSALGVWVLALFALALMGSGCAETAADVQVRHAASQDLECDESALQIVESRPYRKRLEGCGRTVTYVRSCPASSPSTSAWASRCQWLPSVEEPEAEAAD